VTVKVWPVTLNLEIDLDSVKTNKYAKYLGQWSFSSKSCSQATNTHTHSHAHKQINCSIWTTSPQVASWTHTGLHDGLTDTICWHSCTICTVWFVVWRPQSAEYTSTNWWQGCLWCRTTSVEQVGVNWKYSYLSLFTGTKEQTDLLCNAPSVY